MKKRRRRKRATRTVIVHVSGAIGFDQRLSEAIIAAIKASA
jgi:hypothetical protein